MQQRQYAGVAMAIMKERLGRLVWPTIIASAVLIILQIASVIGVLTGAIPLWLGFIGALIAIHASFTIIHEASHKALSGGKKGFGWIDTIAGYIHALMLTYDFPTFKYLHLRHHQFTNDPTADPDYWLQRYPMPLVVILSLAVPLHYLKLYIECARKGLLTRRDQLFTGMRIVFQAGLIIALLIIAPWETFFLWVLPSALASSMISLSHGMLHMPEVTEDRKKTVRMIVGDGFWEWIICPFFWLNNHHYLHHEFPRASCLSHPKMYKATREQLAAEGVEVITIGKPLLSKPPAKPGSAA
ncbi:fatty acid desaturase family protein [Cucumibacter marinus]|uniref:fatty acid desaturase family protein n=1 Tax=Cucumibacter marinus TaxID=1121252 RepID=UPI00042043B1|nr:fatty acid desaturase [Cucumibacter marinus]